MTQALLVLHQVKHIMAQKHQHHYCSYSVERDVTPSESWSARHKSLYSSCATSLGACFYPFLHQIQDKA